MVMTNTLQDVLEDAIVHHLLHVILVLVLALDHQSGLAEATTTYLTEDIRGLD